MELSIHTMQLSKTWSRPASVNATIVLDGEGFYGYDANQSGDKIGE